MPPCKKPSCKLLFILTITLLTLYTLHHHHHHFTTPKTLFYYRNAFLSSSSATTISTYLRHLTLHPHVSGTPSSLTTALYVHSHFSSLSLPTHFSNFSTLLSYHIHSSLTLNSNHLPLSDAATSSSVIPPYHAYSPSASLSAPAVFLNYGTNKDYHALSEAGVDVKGCVGLVRRGGGMNRYEVVENAAEHGVVAVVMYTEGEWKDGVERGTVMKGVGDPVTPGWAGVEGGERLDLGDERVKERFPKVASLPVSQNVAERILASLGGRVAPREWKGIRFVGPGPAVINFTYEVRFV